MIGIVNYKVGNLLNLKNALDFLKIDSFIINNPDDLGKAEKIILPGVGAFGHAAMNLRKLGFWEKVIEHTELGKPLLGICVGMHLLFEYGLEDGSHEGLGLIKGEVKRLDVEEKIPHMGWNRVVMRDTLVTDINSKNNWFYFVHSYVGIPQDKSMIVGKTNYGNFFCSIVNRDNVYGVQFHPEKSQENGLELLRKFGSNTPNVSLC